MCFQSVDLILIKVLNDYLHVLLNNTCQIRGKLELETSNNDQPSLKPKLLDTRERPSDTDSVAPVCKPSSQSSTRSLTSTSQLQGKKESINQFKSQINLHQPQHPHAKKTNKEDRPFPQASRARHPEPQPPYPHKPTTDAESANTQWHP